MSASGASGAADFSQAELTIPRILISIDVLRAGSIQASQGAVSPVRGHHGCAVWIDDGAGQAVLHGHGKEHGVYDLALRQPERNIGHAEYGMRVKPVPDPAHGIECRQGGAAVRGNGHGQAVYDDIFFLNAPGCGFVDDAARDSQPSLRIFRDAVFIEGKGDEDAAVFGGERKDTVEALPFSVDGIDHGLAVADAEPPLQRFRAGSVNLQGQRTDPLELQDNFFHEGGLVDFGQSHIDVKHVRARLLLLDALAEDVIQIFLSQSLLEALLPRGIDALPDQYRPGADLYCSRSGAYTAPVLFFRGRERQ